LKNLPDSGKSIDRGARFMFDVTPLSPSVRPIVLAAADVYYRHTRPWFIGLLIHGSAYKGGVIPGCSDIDLQLYLENEAFDSYGELPIELAAAIQCGLSTIDTGPFQYIQTYTYARNPMPSKPRHRTGPIPGAYHILQGTLPISEATETELLAGCHQTLQNIPTWITNASQDLLQHGGGKLQRAARFMCTDVWPALYSLLTLRDGHPFAIWKLPKEEAIALTAEDDRIGREIRAFYRITHKYFGQEEQSVEGALQVIVQGVKFLQAAERWYGEQ
jgi:hypothetical protein